MTPEEYIKAYTRGNSNELVGGGYHEWLTPENALAAVELARKQTRNRLLYMLNTSIDNAQFFEQLDNYIDELENNKE